MRGSKLRLGRSRSRSSSVVAVIGGCVAVYAVCAVGFHWLVEPTVKSQAVAPYEPSVATIVQPATSYVTPARSNVPSRVTSRPPASATIMAVAPKAVETARSEPPRLAPAMTVTAAGPKATEPSRSELPPPMTVTAAAPQSAEGARSEPPSRVAAPMTAAAPKSAETARAEVSAPVASEAASAVAAATPEATENVAPAPKKPKKVARKAPRHERQRDFLNPMNFFAWGGNNGWRRSF
jgi:hypothetical protein